MRSDPRVSICVDDGRPLYGFGIMEGERSLPARTPTSIPTGRGNLRLVREKGLSRRVKSRNIAWRKPLENLPKYLTGESGNCLVNQKAAINTGLSRQPESFTPKYEEEK